MFSNICNSIASHLTANGHTVSIAESSTGGLIAANLLSVPGASSYFKGSSVIYTRESRHAFLDLDLKRVKALKPLTEPMVAEEPEDKPAAPAMQPDMGGMGGMGGMM